MSYLSLYRELRPKIFDDLIGQQVISQSLKNQIINSKIGHAYLFCGTRGTGKTTTAKIFSRAINCENPKDGNPCNECPSCVKILKSQCLDVLELDAASNNGIDKIREIIDEINYLPIEAKYKVYIMDEVHMLSISAVNAFLKTLEEPPERVIFILATTDPQKLPITILSRCQRFDFKRISIKDMSKYLRKVVDLKGIFATDDSLKFISRVSDGAMRDALSILEQCISLGDNKIEYKQIVDMLGIVNNDDIFKITDELINCNIENSLKIVDTLSSSGKDISLFIKDLINHMRNLMICKVSSNLDEIINLSKDAIDSLKDQSNKINIESIMRYIKILQEAEEQSKWTKQTRLYLEIAIIKICRREYDTSSEVILTRLNSLEKNIKCDSSKAVPVESKKQNASDLKKKDTKDVVKKDVVKKDDKIDTEVSDVQLDFSAIKGKWNNVLNQIKARRYMSLYASLLTGEIIDFKDNCIVIKFSEEYKFNKKRLEQSDNMRDLAIVLEDIFKTKLKVKFETYGLQEMKKEDKIKEMFGEDIVDIIDE